MFLARFMRPRYPETAAVAFLYVPGVHPKGHQNDVTLAQEPAPQVNSR